MDEHGTQQRIPITILTGFLGSGKTTILNHLITSNDMTGVALLINEFGQIGIDHHLIESADETTMLLDSGCICCTIQGGVVDALKRLLDRVIKREIPRITRILIETTGLADPVPVVQTIMQQPFVASRFVCDGVVTVVEATLHPQDIEQFPEAIQQISSADKVLISKVDLADTNTLQEIKQYIDYLNPNIPVMEVCQGNIHLSDFLAKGIYAQKTKKQLGQWLPKQHISALNSGTNISNSVVLQKSKTRHQSQVGTISFTFKDALPWLQFTVNMGKILARLDKRLLRCKGILNVAGEIKPVVIHAVRGEAFPAIQLNECLTVDDGKSASGRLVFIVHQLQTQDIAFIQEHLKSLGTVNHAFKQIKIHPFLPTRSWLKQCINWTTPLIEHDAWLIHPKHLKQRV
ncbi:hypothetical protein BRY75_13535 [Acinetobacter baumannii]|nr:hypothetical protein BRY75_13535 [Acinetobacter baumannii]